MLKHLSDIPGLGAKSINDLAKFGVQKPADLLEHYPSRHEDYSRQKPIGELVEWETVTVRGEVKSISKRRANRKKMTIIQAKVEDGTGSIAVVWFNQPYLLETLKPGTSVMLSGKVEGGTYGRRLQSPVYEVVNDGEGVHTGRIVPVYPLTGSLTQKRLRTAIRRVLDRHVLEDWLPVHIQDEHGLFGLSEAMNTVHFPKDGDTLALAKHRLQFDELFLYELAHLKSREDLKQLNAPIIPFAGTSLKRFVDGLPFTLTNAQRKAAWQIVKDMETGRPMNRLLEGDVGSGKTVVASLAALNVSEAGLQTAMLAPTEILADQHFKTVDAFLGASANVALLTRTKFLLNGKTLARGELLDLILGGDVDIVVGTHALIQQDVAFHELGLVVVDEQHRFGVRQRKALKEKQSETVLVPHLLSMTATPIPRTLALTVYGDLDISILDELPSGRKPVETSIIQKGKEVGVFQKIRSEIQNGQQVFVVCPLIDPSDVLGVRSVQEVADDLKKNALKGCSVAILHGRMKADEKDAVMQSFVNGEVSVLVSTTVVEVGVDVPNATVMLVEGAERFGLAQLHQLRGRVGRSNLPSYCFLRPSGFLPQKSFDRLRALVETNNGFELAERDLALRGPGDMLGTQQSGFPGLKLANIFDVPLVSKARNAAQQLLDQDATLGTWPGLKDRFETYVRTIHFE